MFVVCGCASWHVCYLILYMILYNIVTKICNEEVFTLARSMEVDDFGVERGWEYLAPNRWRALLGSILNKNIGNGFFDFNELLFIEFPPNWMTKNWVSHHLLFKGLVNSQKELTSQGNKWNWLWVIRLLPTTLRHWPTPRPSRGLLRALYLRWSPFIDLKGLMYNLCVDSLQVFIEF